MNKLAHAQLFMVLAAALLSLAVWPLPAAMAEEAADKPRVTEEARSQARKLGKEGIRLLNQRRYQAAIERFERAEALFHAPTHLLFIARARGKLGQLIAAHRAYVNVASEAIPDYAPEAFHKAQQAARKELEALRGQVPAIVITIADDLRDDARIRIDDEPLSAATLAYPIALEPGEHSLQATAPSKAPLSLRIQLAAGDIAKPIVLRFHDADIQPDAAASLPQPPSGDDSGPSLLAPAAVALSIGAAGLIAGAVTGGITLSQAAEVKETCIDGHCPPEQQDKGERANTLGNVSTAMFVMGGVGAVTGVVLLLVDPAKPAAAADAAAVPAPRLSLRLGLGRFVLTGTF